MPPLELVHSYPEVFVGLAGFLGLLVGSFLNVVIYRLPVMMEREWRSECRELLNQPNSDDIHETLSLLFPRSHCPHCRRKISALENIPILSYLFLGGKCRSCKANISLRYPVVELLSCVMVATVAWRFGFGFPALGGIILTWALISLSAIDVDTYLLPDSVTIPALWLGITFNLFNTFTDLESSVIGAIAGYLALWSVYILFKLLTGKEGMGFGDFKLLAMLGAWLGWQALPIIIIASSFVGAVVGITLILFRINPQDKPIPFGPYLAAAGWVTLLWGGELSHAYLTWAKLA